MDNPGDAKYGMTTEQIFEAFKIMKEKGVEEFGIHSFLCSNTVTNDYYPMLAKVLFELAVELKNKLNVKIGFNELEMPVVYVLKTKFWKFRMGYGIIILIAIFTTAISVGISFLNNVCKNEKSFPQFALVLCITSVLISNFGFSNLVKVSFPLFGYLGLIQMWKCGKC